MISNYIIQHYTYETGGLTLSQKQNPSVFKKVLHFIQNNFEIILWNKTKHQPGLTFTLVLAWQEHTTLRPFR